MKSNTLKILNVLALIAVLGVNYLSNALPINGMRTNVISDKNYNEFAPAGVTFSIWGVIYALLIAVMIWQFVYKNEAKEDAISKISGLFILNCLLNITWLFLWHYEILAVSVVVMLGLLYTLVHINTIISDKFLPQTPSKTLLKAAFGVYLGWICIATIANITTWLVSIKWDALGYSLTFWASTVIGIGALIATYITWRFHNMFIGLAVIWAFIGIILKQDLVHSAFTTISWAAAIAIIPVGISLFNARTWKYLGVLPHETHPVHSQVNADNYEK